MSNDETEGPTLGVRETANDGGGERRAATDGLARACCGGGSFFLELTCPQMHTGRLTRVAVVGRYLALGCANIGTSNYCVHAMCIGL